MSVKLPIKAAFFPKNIKVWGHTQTILLTEDVHIAIANLNKGGYSSIHSHTDTWNRFFVISGLLEIKVFRNEQEEITQLRPGEALDIEPLLEHQMAALEDTQIIEMYWAENGAVVDPKDIVRRTNGGLNKESKLAITVEIPSFRTLIEDKIKEVINGTKEEDDELPAFYEPTQTYPERDLLNP